jgi:4-hydroxy-tetrahydrodipicolinate reductase
MPIKVLVNGAAGRMGQIAVRAIQTNPALSLVGQTTKDDNLSQALADTQARVVIDFTHPAAVWNNVQTLIAANVHPVIGTTGLNTQQIDELSQQCAKLKLGAIIAPNFSLGAVLMMKYAHEIAKYLPDVEIIEMHHPQKADSPSGTALYAAKMLKQATNSSDHVPAPAHETLMGARGADYAGIPIHAVRLPGLLAHLQILFGNTGETLTLRHDTINRDCYIAGIRLACEKVVSLQHLHYGLENIL